MRLAYATVVVRDLARARDWYRDVLGFRVEAFRERSGWCVVRPPRSTVRLALLQPRASWGPVRRAFLRRRGTPTGLVLHVPDLAAEHRRLRALGVAFAQPPRREPWGAREARFRDPDGNEFYLVEAR